MGWVSHWLPQRFRRINVEPGGFSVGDVDASDVANGAILAEILFTQTSGNGVYTGTIPVPAGARLLDVGLDGQALWDGTSASAVVGDTVDPDGFLLATDLKAVALLPGEINNIEHPGGLAGAYIGAEQRVLYQATARNIICVITQVGTGTLGRTRFYVVYALPKILTAVKV